MTAPDRGAHARDYLERARTSAGEQVAAGVPGDEVARMLAGRADALLRALHEAAQTLPSAPRIPLAIIATGGYGRAELCPHSDLDLLFLVPAGADATAVQALAESILYPLWDLKLAVGHSVRDIPSALEAARDDVTAATALLDARLVVGEAGLAGELADASWRALAAAGTNDFVRKLTKEVAERHARFGETPFLLEPNVKSGEGSYRDLCVSL